MKIYVPSYYSQFKCTADKCKDTCCAGWDVDIDDETAEIYKTSDIVKVREKLTKDDFGYMFELQDNRCPFLDKNNLCEIQIEKGEDYLCRTCRLFPRYVEEYSDICEMGLGFACPEAAKIILEYDNTIEFVENGETDEHGDIIDKEYFDTLLFLRKMLLDTLDQPLPFKEKLSMIVQLTEQFDSEEISSDKSFDEMIDIMLKLEFIEESRIERIKALKEKKFERKSINEFESDFVKLMQYYIMRYFLTAVHDYSPLEKIKIGVFACLIISRIYENTENINFDKRVDIMYQFSREVEYSTINLDLLADELSEISAENLLELL